MRRIDADALKETISKYEFTAPNEMYKHGGECVLNFYMPKIIDDAPTIEAEPVRHGKWECVNDDENVYMTSCCGGELLLESGTPLKHEMIFCPYCGARMDGGKNNDLC